MLIKPSTRGFNLIEVLIALSIMTILATIAYNSYQQHLQKSYRSQAINQLLKLQLAQERYHLQYDRYADLTELTGKHELIIADNKYTIHIPQATSNQFTITATAQAGQQTDKTNNTACAKLSLTTSNLATIKTPRECWVK